MDLETFKRLTQQTTTVLVEYIPDANPVVPQLTIHKIGASDVTLSIGMVQHELAKRYPDNARQYVVGVPLNADEQLALLNSSEADQLAWFTEQLRHNQVVYTF